MDNVTIATNLSSSSGPAPSQFPPSGEVQDVPCVAFPWYSSAGVGSGPRELIGVKVKTLDTHPSKQMEPRHSQPGLFGWHTIPTSTKQVWSLRHTHQYPPSPLDCSHNKSPPLCCSPSLSLCLDTDNTCVHVV